MNFKKNEENKNAPRYIHFLTPLKISGKSVQSSLRNPADKKKKGGGVIRKKKNTAITIRCSVGNERP